MINKTVLLLLLSIQYIFENTHRIGSTMFQHEFIFFDIDIGADAMLEIIEPTWNGR